MDQEVDIMLEETFGNRYGLLYLQTTLPRGATRLQSDQLNYLHARACSLFRQAWVYEAAKALRGYAVGPGSGSSEALTTVIGVGFVLRVQLEMPVKSFTVARLLAPPLMDLRTCAAVYQDYEGDLDGADAFLEAMMIEAQQAFEENGGVGIYGHLEYRHTKRGRYVVKELDPSKT